MKNILGQAVLEYLIVFAFLSFIGVSMVKGVGDVAAQSMGSLNYVLSQHLTVGVCERLCYYNGYINRLESR